MFTVAVWCQWPDVDFINLHHCIIPQVEVPNYKFRDRGVNRGEVGKVGSRRGRGEENIACVEGGQ